MLAVIYARITDEKDSTIELTGVYLGGIASVQPEAEHLARECVGQARHGIVIPMIRKLEGLFALRKLMNDAKVTFSKKIQEMIVTSRIINRPARKSKSKR